MTKRIQLAFILFLTLLLSACSISFANDVTPPPGSNLPPATKPPTEETTSKIIYPLVAPSASNGEKIFKDNCVLCHGKAGLGDGVRAIQLPNPVPAIGTAEVAKNATPEFWFLIIKNGNMESSMPAFRSLTDRQRWDVIAYIYSLSVPEHAILAGKDIFKESCASCHGETGRGDGTQIANLEEKPQNLKDLSFTSKKSNLDFFQSITEGVSPSMPAYEDLLSERERWALVDYIRSLSFRMENLSPSQTEKQAADIPVTSQQDSNTSKNTNVEEPDNSSADDSDQPVPEIESADSITSTLGTVSGVVINTNGGDIPIGTEIILHIFDQVQQVFTTTTKLDDNNSYLFTDVEMPIGRTFVTTIEFKGATYGSRIVTIQEETDTLDMPIQVYETITDPTVLSIDRLHLFFDFIDEETLQIGELYIISNNSGKTLVPENEGEATVSFSIPEGAKDLQIQNGSIGDRFISTSNGFADTIPVYPGAGNYQMMYSYEMPYNNKLTLEKYLPIRTNAVVILIPENGLKIKGENIQDMGTRDAQGVVYHMYSAGNFSPAETLQLTISGKMSNGASLGEDNTNSLLIGGGALAIALIVAGLWMFQRNQKQNKELEQENCEEALMEHDSPENIMDAILALDDLYDAGEIPEEAFLERRATLKTHLRKLLAEQEKEHNQSQESTDHDIPTS